MDALAIRAAEAAVHPNFPAGRHGADRRARRPGGGSARRCSTIVEDDRAGGAARRRSRSRTTTSSARASGRAARRRSRRWAACRRTTTCRTASCRARSCPKCSSASAQLEARSGLRIGNVFHAGDGNLHPLICYDERDPGPGGARRGGRRRDPARTASRRAARSPASTASAPTRREYMPKMFTADDLDAMQRVRCAFDPRDLCNPGKVFPTPRLCGEVPGPYRAASGRSGGPGGAVLRSRPMRTTPCRDR